MTLSSQVIQKIASLNESNENNVIAGRLLPDDWQGQTSLNVLALALWGITEREISVMTPGPGITDEQLEYQLSQLLRVDPALAMREVEENCDGDCCLDLHGVTDPILGATDVLESIRSRMDSE